MTEDNASPSEIPLPEGTEGRHILRWLVLIALAVGLIVAGRRFAISRADKEFEERLRLSDETRD